MSTGYAYLKDAEKEDIVVQNEKHMASISLNGERMKPSLFVELCYNENSGAKCIKVEENGEVLRC